MHRARSLKGVISALRCVVSSKAERQAGLKVGNVWILRWLFLTTASAAGLQSPVPGDSLFLNQAPPCLKQCAQRVSVERGTVTPVPLQ